MPGTTPASFIAPLPAGVELPTVPATTTGANAPLMPPTVEQPVLDLKSLTPTSKVVQAAPGKLVTATISDRFPNRIVTPFQHPIIGAASNINLSTSGDGPTIYVTVKHPSSTPIAFYLMEKGDESHAIPMMLIPAPVGMTDLRLVGDASMPPPELAPAKDATAEKFEQGSDYTGTISKVMRSLALGDVPTGYGLRRPMQGDIFPSCSLPTVVVSTKQVLTGHDFMVYVSKATNIGDNPVEIHEENCASARVVAVAEWPNVLLQSGQSTELYQVVRRTTVEADTTSGVRRPSVLEGQ
ncbi:MAG: hypothetical protein ACREPQ_14055 [Rhodanobacter sp.]